MTKNIYEKACAKINLGLDVIRKRADGYHELKMVMQTIDLHDDIIIEETSSDHITIQSDSSYVSSEKDDIAYKAAALICREFSISKGIHISIKKRIPVAAGMAGGSSDAAAVIRGMNRLFNLNMDTKQMQSIGKMLGADVPYCIEGGTMLAEGIGDILTPLRAIEPLTVLVGRPNVEISTKEVYKSLDIGHRTGEEHPDVDKIVQDIENEHTADMARDMGNILELVTMKHYPVIKELKQTMLDNYAMGSMMSGSGPTVFGLYSDEEKAKKTQSIIMNKYNDVYTACAKMCAVREEKI